MALPDRIRHRRRWPLAVAIAALAALAAAGPAPASAGADESATAVEMTSPAGPTSDSPAVGDAPSPTGAVVSYR